MEVVTSKYCRGKIFTIKQLSLAVMILFLRDTQICLSINYPLGEMREGNKLWTNWNKATLRLWQTQLNLAVISASSACGVSSEHLNYKKHPMVTLLY